MNKNYTFVNEEGEDLYHHGILGMKWGVRRYQPYPKGEKNKGTFIDKKKKQYANAYANKKAYQQKKRDIKAKILGKNKPAKNIAKTDKNKPSQKAKIKAMSDEELRKRINRLQMEKQYETLSNGLVSKGKNKVTDILGKSATQTATLYTVKAITKAVEKVLKIAV